MAAGNSSANLTFAVGLVGNAISLLVFLSPLPTFYKVYKKKSTAAFQAAPYIVGLFSSMLWIYYALLKTNAMLLITINSVGCFIQTFYICFFLFYAPKKARIRCLVYFVLLIIVGFGLILVLTHFLASGATRGVIVGWICLVFSLCVFLAPLGVLKIVIKSKSVEFMPILLTVALTTNAVVWFFYGLLLRDINIAIPNILGFLLGVVQMILYFVYKYKNRAMCKNMIDNLEEGSCKDTEEQKIPEEEVQKEQKVIGFAMGVLICAEIPTLNRSKSSIPVASKLDKSKSMIPVLATLNKTKSMIPVATLNKSKSSMPALATLKDRELRSDLPANSVAINPRIEPLQTIDTTIENKLCTFTKDQLMNYVACAHAPGFYLLCIFHV